MNLRILEPQKLKIMKAIVNTNRLWTNFVLLFVLGFSSLNLNAQICNLANNIAGKITNDTVTFDIPLGECEVTKDSLLKYLGIDTCANAQLSSSAVFPLGTSETVILDDSNTDSNVDTFVVEVKGLEPGVHTGIDAGSVIVIPLNTGECATDKDMILDQLNVTPDVLVRSNIKFIQGLSTITSFIIGDTIYVDEVECNGYTYWNDVKIIFQPWFPTVSGFFMGYDIGNTTCKLSIDEVIEDLMYDTPECEGRLDISNSGPFGYGRHIIEYIKLDEFLIADSIEINVFTTECIGSSLILNLPQGQCFLNEQDVIDTLGFDNICSQEDIALFPPGPYLTSPAVIDSVQVDGVTVLASTADCSGSFPLTINFTANNLADELTTLFCNDDLNISLNAECKVTLNAGNILQGGPYCYLNYLVKIEDEDGNVVDEGHEPMITTPGHYVVTVTNPRTGVSCWNWISVEDKYIFETICEPDTVLCYDNNELMPDTLPDLGPDFPNLGEPAQWTKTDQENFYSVETETDCGVRYAFYVDQVVDECTDEGFKYVIDRLWQFEDEAGNVDTCIQTIYVENVSIDWVDDFEPLVANCIDEFDYLDEQGHPSPEETGYPTVDTFFRADVCGSLKLSYSDTKFQLCGNSYKLAREWIILDWCTNEVDDRNHVIIIQDTVPPEIIEPLEDIWIPMDPFVCGVSNFEVPIPDYVDCQDDPADIEILYETKNLFGEKEIVSNGSNTTISELSIEGYHGDVRVYVVLTDDCGNSTTDTMDVHIRDDDPPIAVCDEFTVVSMGGNGTAQVYAYTFDDLSVDNCGIAEYEVRKMNGDCHVYDEFDHYVRFCCSEIGDTILVEFRVTDYAGNSNSCMVNVHVQDKFPPRITCPPDIVIDCRDDYEDLYVTGEPTAIDNCDLIDVSYEDDVDIGNCGEGVIMRTWTATDRAGLTSSCVQKIYVVENESFSMTDEDFPQDTIVEGCREDLTAIITGQPDIDHNTCAEVAYSHEDTYFNTVEGACFKIIRKWTVIDWCQYSTSNQSEGLWVFSQVIKQRNIIGPEFIDPPTDTTFCIYGDDCIGDITLTLDAIDGDGCTPQDELIWFYQIFREHYENDPIASGLSASFSGELGEGNYVAKFRVSDGCSNFENHTVHFTVVDCEPPVITCPPFSSSVVLTQNGENTVWLSDIDLKKSDNCTEEEDIIFSFSPDSIVTNWVFTCDDIPNGISYETLLRIYGFDEAGNVGFCELAVEIQDNSNDVCPDIDAGMVALGGEISTEETAGVDNVSVSLFTGSSRFSMITDVSGEYAFSNIQSGRDYHLEFDKTDAFDDGVTTLDLLLIQRHILGVQTLNTPYKVIAADIDNSERISALDLVWLRRIILGLDLEFPNGQKSWRFVDANHEFSNGSSPFPYPEQINLEDLNSNEMDHNVVAIKIGDVNGTNTVSSRILAGGRSDNPMELSMTNVGFGRGEVLSIPVRADQDRSIMGLQHSIIYDISALSGMSIESGVLDLSEENYYFDNQAGELKMSWTSPEGGIEVKSGDALFYINFVATGNGVLANTVNTKARAMQSEMVTDNFESHEINLQIVEETAESTTNDNIVVYAGVPNPFSDESIIAFDLKEDTDVSLQLFDLSGRMLYEDKQYYSRGKNEVKVTADDLYNHSGVIVVYITTKWGRVTQKLTLIR